MIFFFNDTATTEIYTLSLHDALRSWPSSLARTGQPLAGPDVHRPVGETPFAACRCAGSGSCGHHNLFDNPNHLGLPAATRTRLAVVSIGLGWFVGQQDRLGAVA